MGVLYRIILFILVLASAFFYAQDSIVGLENIHVIGNAVIVSQNTNEYTVTYITENSIKKVKLNSASEKDSKAKAYYASNENKKIKVDEKKTAKKTIKKIVAMPNDILVYNKNSKTDENLFSQSIFYKIGFTSTSYSVGKNISNENSFLNFLFVFQEKQNILYHFYKCKNVENFLFTRPPPAFSEKNLS